MTTMRRWLSISLLLSLPFFAGCGLFTSDLTIDLPTQTFSFQVDADQVGDELRAQIKQEYGVDVTGATIPNGVPNFTFETTVEFPPQSVDLSKDEKLKDYVAASKVKEIKFKFIKYDITQNTLNFNLPSADIYMGNLTAANISDPSAKKIATIPSISAGSTAPGYVNFITGGQQIMNTFLKSLKFAVMGTADVTLDTSVTKTIPAGQLGVTVSIGLQAVVDPL